MQNMLEQWWTMKQEQHQQPPSRRDIPSRSGAGTKHYDKGFQDSRHPGAPEKLEEKSQDDKKQLDVDTPTDAANYQKEDEKKEEDQRDQAAWLLEARDPGVPLHGAIGARATDEQHFDGVEQRLEEEKNLEEENLEEEEEEKEPEQEQQNVEKLTAQQDQEEWEQEQLPKPETYRMDAGEPLPVDQHEDPDWVENWDLQRFLGQVGSIHERSPTKRCVPG